MKDMKNRTWVEINLDHIVHNCSVAIKHAGKKEVMCVVKADAYGHGAVEVAAALRERLGIRHFAVAMAEEALQLRRHGIKGEILVLGTPSVTAVKELCKHQISVTVSSLKAAEAFASAAEAAGEKLMVHVKINSGMDRQGIRPECAPDQVRQINEFEYLKITGIYTHLAVADVPEEEAFTLRQYEATRDKAVKEVNAVLKEQGTDLPLFHIQNSAAILAYPWFEADMMRPGIMLYGSNPCPHIDAGLKPTMSLHTRISNLIHVPEGETVGYGRTFTAKRDSLIAVMNIGYADGLFRTLSGKLKVLVHGQRVAQVGRICMDMSMIDVTDVADVELGDLVTIIGRQGDEEITCDEVAALCDTISYEIFCAVDKRVPRIYTNYGEEVKSISYIESL